MPFLLILQVKLVASGPEIDNASSENGSLSTGETSRPVSQASLREDDRVPMLYSIFLRHFLWLARREL